MIDRIRFGLNRIINPSLNIRDFFQLANELELAWVELRNDLPGRKLLDYFTAQEIRYLAQRYHVQICSINALQQFNNLAEIKKIKEELTFLLRVAEEIECKAIVLCPMNKGDDDRGTEKQILDTVNTLQEFMPLFRESGISGYIEPLGFSTSSLYSILTTLEIIKEVRYDGYKIVYDTFHHAIGPDDLEVLARDYDVSFTGLVHVSSVITDIPSEQFQDEHRSLDFVGDRLNSKKQVDFLTEHGYQGVISFEPFAQEVQKLGRSALKERINLAIDYLSNEV
jgi:2-keto-myo-inositol isomerase